MRIDNLICWSVAVLLETPFCGKEGVFVVIFFPPICGGFWFVLTIVVFFPKVWWHFQFV